MSDNAEVLVWRVEAGERIARAAKMLAWLAKHEIVEALPTDSGLGSLAHRPGKRVKDVVVAQEDGVADFLTLVTNGMEVEHSPTPRLYGAGDEVPTFRCPACNNELAEADVLGELDKPAHPFLPVPQVGCSKCDQRTKVTMVVVEGGAFGNLALRFWNWWPLQASFVEELSGICGSAPVTIHEHV